MNKLLFRWMDLKLHWFIWLCLERSILQPSAFALLRKSAKTGDDALAYGERMLDFGIITDREVLESLLNEARDRQASGENPPYDPFAGVSRPDAESAEEQRTGDAPGVGAGKILVSVESAKPGFPYFSGLEGADEDAWRERMTTILRYATASGASDLHLSAGARPFVRRNLELHFLDSEPLSAEVAEGLNRSLLSTHQWESFQEHQDLDFPVSFSSGERYRANLMAHKDGCAGSYRTVDRHVRSLAELGFRNPETIDKLLSYHNGLIIVAGPVGAGKTTTLAALVQQLNQTRDDHLISVEEPIEFIHHSDRAVITQRSVGQHTETFHSALKGALRQDPDIIVIGEMRDLETIEMAVSASETGHLVIGTMHTSDAATTLNRLLDVFPPAQQPQIRAMVAESLRGIICQRLLPARGGGLALATEVLLRNLAVSSLIREGKTEGLGNIMETGKAQGMMTMDSSVLALWRDGKLSDEVALGNLRSEIAGREIRCPASPVMQQTKKRSLFNLTR